jgi:hypothetical protein
MMINLEDWRNGDLTDAEALRHLARDLGKVEDSLAPLEAERKELRTALETITTRLGGKASVPGFGALAVTAPSESASYDTKALDTIAAELLATGDVDLMRVAARIAKARKVSQRAGSLRITREKL